eukprot:CAMPEP_0206587300 /NCGR_PEP_ID=MMETSP0325_2-20121206/37567_1 /ASSEMBLY_ACC=CAM_ASM_000347 /TAXON_ID=2866 /ORGANISM="Crypthecodinium cohnii, Strain Seligo" /LENGTH=128 /DNA_ID=CAMNT_0054095285 /DNA_START=122 /DNA_END=504 /DNA_ORIENTATION=-
MPAGLLEEILGSVPEKGWFILSTCPPMLLTAVALVLLSRSPMFVVDMVLQSVPWYTFKKKFIDHDTGMLVLEIQTDVMAHAVLAMVDAVEQGRRASAAIGLSPFQNDDDDEEEGNAYQSADAISTTSA